MAYLFYLYFFVVGFHILSVRLVSVRKSKNVLNGSLNSVENDGDKRSSKIEEKKKILYVLFGRPDYRQIIKETFLSDFFSNSTVSRRTPSPDSPYCRFSLRKIKNFFPQAFLSLNERTNSSLVLFPLACRPEPANVSRTSTRRHRLPNQRDNKTPTFQKDRDRHLMSSQQPELERTKLIMASAEAWRD